MRRERRKIRKRRRKTCEIGGKSLSKFEITSFDAFSDRGKAHVFVEFLIKQQTHAYFHQHTDKNEKENSFYF